MRRASSPPRRRFVGQQGDGAAHPLDQLLGVAQALALGLEPLVFAGLDRGRLDLVDLEAQQVELALAVAPRRRAASASSRESPWAADQAAP